MPSLNRPLAQWIIGRSISDGQLSTAVQAAIGRATADLLSIGSWVAAYGVVGAAAAASMGERHQRLTPKRVGDMVGGWVERRRASYKNSIVTARWSDYFWDVEMKTAEKSAETEPLRRLYDPSNARSSETAAEYFVDALLKAAGDDPLPPEMRPPRRGRRHFGKRPAP